MVFAIVIESLSENDIGLNLYSLIPVYMEKAFKSILNKTFGKFETNFLKVMLKTQKLFSAHNGQQKWHG
jgi:hypothetical protein